MNKYILILFLTIAYLRVSGQISVGESENGSENNLSIEKVYAGFLFENSIAIDSLANIDPEYSNYGSLRFGTSADWKPANFFSVHMMGSVDIRADEWKNFGEAYAKANVSVMYIKAGFLPTPTTMLRPDPLSLDGQFEFPTFSLMTDRAVGSMLGAHLGGTERYLDAMLGYYLRDGQPEYHAGILGADGVDFNGGLSAYVRANDNAFGMAGSMKVLLLKNLRADFAFSFEAATKSPDEYKKKGFSYTYGAANFGKDLKWVLYSEYGQENTFLSDNPKDVSDRQARMEIGILKYTSHKKINGFAGIAWRAETQSVVAMIAIGL